MYRRPAKVAADGGRRAAVVFVVALGITLGAFAWGWVFGVKILYGSPSAEAQIEAARLAAISGTRTGLLALLVGIGALGTFLVNARTLRITTETFRLSERGHITDRFTKAIEHMGSESLVVRLGGIYALEQVAVDSIPDQSSVVEIISAYAREHSATSATHVAIVDSGDSDSALPLTRPPSGLLAERAAPDVQAAVMVLGRLPTRGDSPRADLRGALLGRCDLNGADLSNSNLRHANLARARLIKTKFCETHMARAILVGANLQQANLNNARLAGARLDDAILRKADLSGADLRLARLVGAQLHQADLAGANLEGAQLHGASLGGAVLLGDAKGLTQTQLNSAKGNAMTRIPSTLIRPADWEQ
jgi:uncharacterized protein YjbI with pentapeptide repeats